MSRHDNIPWVEKYRPNLFDNIILDKHNRTILKNVINQDFHVNMLFYGPPGTGKTTTIINMVNQYNARNGDSKSLVMNLNASDDRGIELIRNQLYTFVNSNNMFTKGRKIIILDEADYMTKLAQQALKLLIEQYTDVRFILICNYITKIDRALQNILMHIRFNNLPRNHIISYLKDLCTKENIRITQTEIENVQRTFEYDIRSMINFIQFNHIRGNNHDHHEYSNQEDEAQSQSMNTKKTHCKGRLGATKKITKMNDIASITKYCEQVVKRIQQEQGPITPEPSEKDNDLSLSKKNPNPPYYLFTKYLPEFLDYIKTFHLDIRFFWIDLYANLFKTCEYSHNYISHINYFVHNSSMSDYQINTLCFHILCKITQEKAKEPKAVEDLKENK